VQKRYRALRFVSGFYKVIGIILGVITLVSALGICVTSLLGGSILGRAAQDLNNSGMPFVVGTSSAIVGIITALITIITGALGALGTYAIGELITLLIDMEENTRVTASLLHPHNPAPVQPAPQAIPQP
jgi:hypothetical protein